MNIYIFSFFKKFKSLEKTSSNLKMLQMNSQFKQFVIFKKKIRYNLPAKKKSQYLNFIMNKRIRYNKHSIPLLSFLSSPLRIQYPPPSS